jgi:hypothetical protein
MNLDSMTPLLYSKFCIDNEPSSIAYASVRENWRLPSCDAGGEPSETQNLRHLSFDVNKFFISFVYV